MPPPSDPSPDDPPAIVRITGVHQSFGDVHALDGIDLEVRRGELLTLLGPSGSGKTTLLRLIAGLEPPSRGEVLVDGRSPDAARADKRIGLVPQAPALLPWRTVRANARLLLDVNRRANPAAAPDPHELLHEVGLGEFLDAMPHEFSGGMQQRVGLVRAFAALVEITRADMRHLLVRLCEHHDTTVVFVTHSLAEAVFLSDRVVVLSQRPGRIVDVVDIDIAHPRRPELEDDPRFFQYETRLRHLLHEGSGR